MLGEQIEMLRKLGWQSSDFVKRFWIPGKVNVSSKHIVIRDCTWNKNYKAVNIIQ